jgi:hypothetical protein
MENRRIFLIVLMIAASLFIILNSFSSIAACGTISISNESVLINSEVIITLSANEISSELVINSPSNSYRLLGDASSEIAFIPKEEGAYSAELWNALILCDAKNFTAEISEKKEPEKTFRPFIVFTDKNEYSLYEPVIIFLNPSDYGYNANEISLKVNFGSESYTFLDAIASNITYYPKREGNYSIELLDAAGASIASSVFSVYSEVSSQYVPAEISVSSNVDLSGIDNSYELSNISFNIRHKDGRNWNYSMRISEDRETGGLLGKLPFLLKKTTTPQLR